MYLHNHFHFIKITIEAESSYILIMMIAYKSWEKSLLDIHNSKQNMNRFVSTIIFVNIVA